MQVGTTKDQGLYNKPSAAVHLGALAAGTLPHNITQFVPDFMGSHPKKGGLQTYVAIAVNILLRNRSAEEITHSTLIATVTLFRSSYRQTGAERAFQENIRHILNHDTLNKNKEKLSQKTGHFLK